jgi:MFS family permease
MTSPLNERGRKRRDAAVDHASAFSWRFTTPMFLGSALNPVDSSLIATALVPIAHGVHASAGRVAALVSALYLASAVAQPTAGKLSEVFGPRPIFLTGIVLVLIGGVLGGLGHPGRRARGSVLRAALRGSVMTSAQGIASSSASIAPSPRPRLSSARCVLHP